MLSAYIGITLATLMIYIFTGTFALLLDARARLNRLFFLLITSVSLCSAGNLIIMVAANSTGRWLGCNLVLISQSFISPLLVHFYKAMADKKAPFLFKPWISVLLFMPAVLFIYDALKGSSIIKDILVYDSGNIRIVIRHSFMEYFNIFYQLTYNTSAMIIFLLWGLTVKNHIERKQAIVVGISSLLTFISAILIQMVLPKIKADTILLAPVSMVFASAGIWYSIVKYRFMEMTPSLAAQNILDTMAACAVLSDPELKILTANKEVCRLLCYKEKELIGNSLDILFENGDNYASKYLIDQLDKGPVRNMETTFVTKEGVKIPVACSASENRDKKNKLNGIVLICKDISGRKQTEIKLKKLARHDFLTKLPNRMYFLEKLNESLKEAGKNNEIIAVALLDVDGFKQVNDTLGHNSGDALLVQIAERLGSTLREGDMLARHGGDEFIFILNHIASREEIPGLAENILKCFNNNFCINGIDLHITISLGLSLYPHDGAKAGDLIKNADLAMYKAKNQGKNNYKLYKSSLSAFGMEKIAMSSDLLNAVGNNEFVVHYQPMVDINSGGIAAMEALVRWHHPEFGLVYPDKFINLADEAGLILTIGEFVLREACRQNKSWQIEGLPKLPVSVCITARQFRQKDFAKKTGEILTENGLESQYLQLEIPESILMKDTDIALHILKELDILGVCTVIGDFSLGYSSFSYLRKLQIKAVKISSFFTKDIADDPDSAAIVAAISAMAHAMDVKVIAVGIENREQFNILQSLKNLKVRSLNFDIAQGNFFTRPAPTEKISLWMKKNMFGDIIKS